MSFCKVARARLIHGSCAPLSLSKRSYTCDPCNPLGTTMYDYRKNSPCLPCDTVCPPFQPLPCIPSGVFRCTTGEILGPNAGKCNCYKNPEYYSFHNMTFYDLMYFLYPCRQTQPNTGRKPN